MIFHWRQCKWQTHFALLQEMSLLSLASFCQSRAVYTPRSAEIWVGTCAIIIFLPRYITRAWKFAKQFNIGVGSRVIIIIISYKRTLDKVYSREWRYPISHREPSHYDTVTTSPKTVTLRGLRGRYGIYLALNTGRLLRVPRNSHVDPVTKNEI